MPRVLIVDDEPAIRSLLALAFRRAGYAVSTAADPLRAMDVCASEAIDVILSDIQMPGMDGHGLIRWVCTRYPAIRSVLMSGYEIICQECPYTGRCTLLRKPFSPHDAVAAVNRALNAETPTLELIPKEGIQ